MMTLSRLLFSAAGCALAAGLALASQPLAAQDSPTSPDSTSQEPVCADPVWLVPESLQGYGALLRDLPRLEKEGSPAPSHTWSTARSLGRTPLCGDHPWLRGWTQTDAPTADSSGLLPVTLRLAVNSSWPVVRTEGLQWSGKGLSGVLRGGWAIRSGTFSLALRPEVAWAENRDFAVFDTTLTDREPGAYPWHARRIDWPLRPGDGAEFLVGFGESHLAADLGALEVALSSEQLTWGPGRAYPLLLGPGAPGFPHLSLSTLQPLVLGDFGTLEGQLLWGLLNESGHFDSDDDNNRRLLSGVVFSLHPRLLPGFSVGAASLVHSSVSDFGVGSLFNFLQIPIEGEGGGNNVDGNGLGSLFARWAVPGSGFEAWVEWARDDYSFTGVDLVSEPDHSQAYAAGFQQVSRWKERGLVRFSGELVHLTNDEPDIEAEGGRSRNAGFYTHATLTQGHTHQGRLLGAPVGPGSDAQRLRLDLLREGYLWGVEVERVRWDDDSYVRWLSDTYGAEGHDVELSLGLRHARPIGDLRLELESDLSFRRNRHFHNLAAPDSDFDWESNFRTQATLTWVPGGGS